MAGESSPVAETLGDSLIPVINNLQDLFAPVSIDLKLDLPQVVVVGSQSSGKSSVLEALVGRDFLPRGNDICTRRPLVLQLVKTPPVSSSTPNEYGEFLHAPGKLFYDFNRIREEIQQETERVVGSNKNVSDKPIRLKIYSPNVLTMTLIDLPGITKVPVGDQPSNIEQTIREMALEYIRPQSSIILAVSPSNADLANSDALQLAQVVDPAGLRTIGVLTKLDIMDRGTSAMHMLRNQVIPLRLGYVAVVNRSQEDINKQKRMADARQAEQVFFDNHPEYREVRQQCGIGNLAKRLNAILVDHIKLILPSLRAKIQAAIEYRTAELQSYGSMEGLITAGQKGAYLLQLVCDYCERYASMLEGRHNDLSTMNQLAGGARIRHVFTEVYGKEIKETRPAMDISDDEIITLIKNGAGVSGVLLVAQEAFELLVRRSILNLLPPSLMCKSLVYEQLIHIAEQAFPPQATRFPVLQKRLAGSVLEFIRCGASPADSMIRSLVDCEHGYINVDHPEFIGGRGAIRQVMQDRSMRLMQQARKQDAEPSKDNAKAKPLSTITDMPNVKIPSAKDLNQPLGLKAVSESVSIMHSGMHSTQHDNPEIFRPLRSRGDEDLNPPPSSSWFSYFFRDKGDKLDGRSQDDMLMVARAQGHRQHTEAEEVEVEVIRRLVDNYFSIVKKTMQDQVPKVIMHYMVNHTKKGLQQHLIQALYKESLMEELLSEREDVVQRRESCREALTALKQAAEALEEVPAILLMAHS